MRVSDFMRGIGNMAARTTEERLPQVEATIKQRISASEAVVQIEGREVRATFEKGVPSQSRVTVQITGETDTTIEVRTVSGGRTTGTSSESAEAAAEKLLRDAGAKPTSEMKEAVRILTSNKAPVTKETVATVQQIMSKGEGTVQQKLDVLTAMAQKNIDVTPKSFEAVFRTMHGPTLGALMEELANELPELAPSAKQAVANEVQTAANNRIVGASSTDAARLVQQMQSVASAIEQAARAGGSLNKDELQKAVKVMEQQLERLEHQPGAVSEETTQKVKQVVDGIKQAIQETPATEQKVAAERVLKHVSARDVELAAKQVAQEVKTNAVRSAEQVRSVPQQASDNKLSRQLETIAQVISDGKPIDKAALQALVRQMKTSQELVKLPLDTQQKVQEVIRNVEQAIRRTPVAERTVGPERLAQQVPARQITEVAKQVEAVTPKEEPSAQPEVAKRSTTTVASSVSAVSSTRAETSKLAQQLSVLAEAMESRQPLNKEAIQRLMQQIKMNPELPTLSRDVQQQVRAIAEKVGQAVKETPPLEPAVSPERMARYVQSRDVQEIARRATDELTRSAETKSAGTSQTSSSAQSSAPASQSGTLSRQLETIAQAISDGKPIDKAALQALVRQMKTSQELIKLPPDTQQKVQDIIRNVEQAVHRTPAAERTVAPERLAQQVPARQIVEVAKQVEAVTPKEESSAQPEVATRPTTTVTSSVSTASSTRAETSKLAQQLSVLAEAMESRQPLNKEAIQRLMQQIKTNPELPKAEPAIQQQVQRIVQGMEAAIQQTPSKETVIPSDRLAAHVSATEVKQAAEAVRISENRQSTESIIRTGASTQVAGTRTVALQGEQAVHPESTVTKQLDILAQAISRQQPLNKDILQKLAQQILRNPELPTFSRDVQQQVRVIAEKVEQAVKETSASEPAVTPERLAHYVQNRDVQEVARRATDELTRLADEKPAGTSQTSSSAQKEVSSFASVPQNRELTRQLEILNQAVSSRQPLDKEALRQLTEQIKQNPGLSMVSRAAAQQIHQVAEQVERAIQETPAEERTVSPDRLARYITPRDISMAAGRITKEPQSVLADQSDTRQVRQTQPSDTPQKEKVEQAARQLEMIAARTASGKPIPREMLEQAVHQIRETTSEIQSNRDATAQLRNTADKLEQVLRQLPQTVREVPTEQIERRVSAQDMKRAAEVALQQVKETEVRSTEPTVSSERRRLAEMVLDIRTTGKVTRPQIEAIQQAVEQVVTEAGGSEKLRQSTSEFMDRLGRDLRMSMSYEAVGRSAEAKAMVQRSVDQLVQLFKLPVAEAARTSSVAPTGEMTSEASPRMLETMGQMYDRLSGIVAAARAEMKSAQGVTAAQLLGGISDTPDVADLLQARTPQQIMQDVAQTLLNTAEAEGIPSEMKQKISGILEQMGQAVNGEEEYLSSESKVETPTASKVDVDVQMQQLQQLFDEEAGRMAAYANVQTANFERVSHYIPDHLRETAAQFKQVKKEIGNNVDRMMQFLDKNVPQASSYIKKIIEPTIEMVDRLVSKGEFALFADMEFEHDVLTLSSRLQEIKGMLSKGQNSEALTAFRDVRQQLDKLNWQPSYMKVERFFSKQVGEGAMQNPLELYTRDWRNEQLTGRGIQEWMRGMGMNHEREAIDWMMQRAADNRDLNGGMNNFSSQQSQVSSRSVHVGAGGAFDHGDSQSSGQGQPHSMKSFLMEQIENNTVSPRAKEMMEQALSNVTGQQLLSRQDPGVPMQSMYVQLPLPWEEGMKTVHVQINSRNNGEQMDWENCSLFFFLDTPKYGDTGIGVTVVDREMTIRVQNNYPNTEQVFAPYIPQLKNELQGLGYRVQAVSFGAFAPTEETKHDLPSGPAVDVQAARADVAKQLSGREGVDFSV
ncbi:DUF6240 domain-containing protein [Aneurinibacillus uraniidurans]|uniref:DUF6240 domain-containing protein n=1 Tax=Aneurinibacillus uraniidurans TaxID=2966586 RepID=UPI002349A795|nr:DUF6240 domain-containing protein [Aneurinibacillus sp. B1]WCN38151.1 DUF6240 domain-containing protein [Aneurinibacillus sp. B1]